MSARVFMPYQDAASPTGWLVVDDETGTVVVAEEPICMWWALCPNEATTTEPHPILGAVPICDRCQASLRAMEVGR